MVYAAVGVSIFLFVMPQKPMQNTPRHTQSDDPGNGNQPHPPESTGGQPNWGLWMLLAVVVGVIMLLFVYDGGLGGGKREMSLGEFVKQYRSGMVITNNPKEYPIQDITNENGNSGIIRAVMYKDKPQFAYGRFYMPFTDSDEIKALCNRYGITNTVMESADSPVPEPEPDQDRVWSTDQFRTLGEEGRIDMSQAPTVYLRSSGNGVIIGGYRKDPQTKVNRRQVGELTVPFSGKY